MKGQNIALSSTSPITSWHWMAFLFSCYLGNSLGSKHNTNVKSLSFSSTPTCYNIKLVPWEKNLGLCVVFCYRSTSHTQNSYYLPEVPSQFGGHLRNYWGHLLLMYYLVLKSRPIDSLDFHVIDTLVLDQLVCLQQEMVVGYKISWNKKWRSFKSNIGSCWNFWQQLISKFLVNPKLIIKILRSCELLCG